MSTSCYQKKVINVSLLGSVEIPDLTSLPEIHDEPVLIDITRGDICHARWQDRFEKTVIGLFSKCDEGTRENNPHIIF
jgi:hypothetical protein